MKFFLSFSYLAQMLRFAFSHRMDSKYTTILLWAKCNRMRCFGECIRRWMRKISSRFNCIGIDILWQHRYWYRRCRGKYALIQFPYKYTPFIDTRIHKPNDMRLLMRFTYLSISQLVGFIFACCLSNHIRNYKRRLAY